MFNLLYHFISRHALASGCRKQKKPSANALGLIGDNSEARHIEHLGAVFCTVARRGVTVLEVLFATGIAVFGMVGIASLLAVGGRQASDANNWSEGQAAAQNALSDFVVRGYGNSALWSAFNDQATGSLSNHFIPFNSVLSPLSRYTSTGGNRTDNRHAVCIDPYFFSDPTTADNVISAFPNTQPYRPGLFPYFQDDFNPLDPTTGLGGNAARLLRVSVQNPTGGLLSAQAAKRQFQLLDDLAITTDDDDKTLPAERVLSFLSGGVAAQGLSNGEYSWFATLCPREVSSSIEVPNTISPENLFTLSIVVCKRRDRAFFVPASGMQGPLGERVVAVTPPYDAVTNTIIQFKGGSGGRVILSAARDPNDPALDISESLRAGDWVMLCKESSLGGGGLMTICRWYRVLTLDIETDISAGSNWKRSVILDGPDWVFDTTYPTQATLVNGVITVVERVISIR